MSGNRVAWSFVLAGVAAVSVAAQQPPAGSSPPLEVLKVRGGVYMLAGAGGNITVQTGHEGVLLVNTGTAASASRMLAEVRTLSTGPIRWVINTDLHPENIGGNETIAALPPDPLEPLKIVAQENVLNRLTSPAAEAKAPAVERGLPLDEYFMPFKDLHFNDEAIFVYHEPNAHTDGDSVVLFRGSDVVSAGDVFTPDQYPLLDLDNGGSVRGEIAALNHILDLTVPAHTEEGGTYVVPGHGRLSDEDDVVEFRDMVVIIRDRIVDLIKKGQTLEQVKMARPSLDYDEQYVTGFMPADKFVETMYTDLSKSMAPRVEKRPAAPAQRRAR